MIPTLRQADKVVIVTGASRGIGRSIAEVFAASGATVHGIARSLENLKSVEESINSTGGRFIAHACDVSDLEDLHSVLNEIIASETSIDILINNAGIYATAAVRNMEISQWSSTMNINCSAAFVAAKSVLDRMISQKSGRIVFISSISGKNAEPFGAAYSSSKFAMLGLMQALALEVAPHGITSNAICPGWVDTEMTHNQINDELWCSLNELDVAMSAEVTRLSVPQERLIDPVEVAHLALYLCSDAARGITGQAINICGGLSIR